MSPSSERLWWLVVSALIMWTVAFFSQCFTNEKPMVDGYERSGKALTKLTDMEFGFKSKVESGKRVQSTKLPLMITSDDDIVGMVFSRVDKHCSEDRRSLRSRVVASGSLVPVGPVYVVVSVRETVDPILQQATTWLTCKRQNGVEKLDGLSLLEDLQAHVGGDNSYLCVGTLRQRRCGTKLGQREFFNLHEVQQADEEYLYVDGKGIKTGDKLRFYCTDVVAARAENRYKMDKLAASIMTDICASSSGPSEFRKASPVGGLMFSCIGRGETFFNEANVDSGDFLQRFPDVSLAGMFCLGEIGPLSVLPWQITNPLTTQQRQMVINFYSNICTLFSQDV